MKIKQFEILCESCDKILFKSLKPERIANNWVNVIRPHPIFTSKYDYLFTTKYLLFKDLKKLLLNVLGIFYHLISSFIFFFKKKAEFSENYDSIFISNLVDESSLKSEKDFYFHKFCSSLFDRNKSLFIYINNSKNEYKDSIYKVSEKIDKIIFRKYLNPIDEIKIILKLFKDAISIILIKSETKFEKRIKIRSAIEAISPSSLHNMRIGLQTFKIVENVKPNYLFTLYEGFSWERLVFYYSKKAKKEIKTIGYQHVFIFNHHYSLNRKVGPSFYPNYLMCSSKRNKQIFIDNHEFYSTNNVFMVGTERSSNSFSIRKDLFNNPTILFLPEGDINESVKFIKFSIKSALKNPSVQHIVRFHPVVEKYINKHLDNEYGKQPINWIISNETLELDLKRSSFALYRGSSTIIKAIKNGLVPIFYKIDNNSIIDPLSELEKYKYSVTTIDQLTEFLKLDKSTFLKNIKKINQKIDYYLSPIDEQELSRFKKTLIN